MGQKANWGGLVEELVFLFVTQFMSLEPSKVTTQNGEEWGTFHRQFLIRGGYHGVVPVMGMVTIPA